MDLNFENDGCEEMRMWKKNVSKYENQFVTKRWKNRHRKKQEKQKNKISVLRSYLHERVRKSKRKYGIKNETNRQEDVIQSHVKNKGRKLPRKQHIIKKRKKSAFEQRDEERKVIQNKREEGIRTKIEWLHDTTTRCISYSNEGCVLYPSNIQRYCDKYNAIDFSKHKHLQDYDEIFEPESEESNSDNSNSSSNESEEEIEIEEEKDDGTVKVDVSIKFILNSHRRLYNNERRKHEQNTECSFDRAVVNFKYQNQLVCRCELSSNGKELIPLYEHLLFAVQSKKIFYYMAQCSWENLCSIASCSSNNAPLWSHVVQCNSSDFLSIFPLDIPRDIATMLCEFLGFFQVHCVEVSASNVIFTQVQIGAIIDKFSLSPTRGNTPFNETPETINFSSLKTSCNFALQSLSPVGFGTSTITKGYSWTHPQDLFLHSKAF